MPKMYPPEQLTIDYQTYEIFCKFCELCAKGYIVSEVKDHGKKIGLLTIYMNKSEELNDVSTY